MKLKNKIENNVISEFLYRFWFKHRCNRQLSALAMLVGGTQRQVQLSARNLSKLLAATQECLVKESPLHRQI